MQKINANMAKVLNSGDCLVKEIVSEILCQDSNSLLAEIESHNKTHKAVLMKRIVFSFITIKGKHICRTYNQESNFMTRHRKIKSVIFMHE